MMICPGILRPFLGRWLADLVGDVFRLRHAWLHRHFDYAAEERCVICDSYRYVIGHHYPPRWVDGRLPGSEREMRP